MQQIEEEFTQYLNSFNFNRPKIPVISNVTAQYYPNSSTAIKKLLAQQLTSMVKWKETIELVDNMFPNIQIEEIGSGNILTKLISQTRNLQ